MHGSSRKVKVYDLVDQSEWRDIGTGYIEIRLDSNETYSIIVKSQQDSDGHEDIEIIEPFLLEISIASGNEFSLHDTSVILIARTQTQSVTGISFQDENCKNSVWDLIKHAAGRIDDTSGHLSDPEGSPPTEQSPTPPVAIPFATCDTLCDIASILSDFPQLSGPLRARWLRTHVPQMIDEIWLTNLISCYATSDPECNESCELFFLIAKAMLLLPSSELVDRLVRSDVFPAVIAMLEFDGSKHTEFFVNQAKYRSVGLTGRTVEAIHETFRITYLKDVALARFLDDSALQTLSQLCQRNYTAIFTAFGAGELNGAASRDILDFLFVLTTQIGRPFILESKEKLLDAVVSDLVVTRILSEFLSPESLTIDRSRCLEILASLSISRPALLRALPLVERLCDIIARGGCEATTAQAGDVLRSLLDPADDESFLREVYCSKIPVTLASSAADMELSAFSRQVFLDLLTFILGSHGYFAKNFFLKQGTLLLKALRSALDESSPKIVQLAAVRVLRAAATTRDVALARGLSQGGVWVPFLRALSRARSRGAIFSAGSELLNFLAREKVTAVIDCLIAEGSEASEVLDELSSLIPAVSKLRTARTDSVFVLRVRDSVFLERHDSFRSEEGNYCVNTDDENLGKNQPSSPKRPRLDGSVN